MGACFPLSPKKYVRCLRKSQIVLEESYVYHFQEDILKTRTRQSPILFKSILSNIDKAQKNNKIRKENERQGLVLFRLRCHMGIPWKNKSWLLACCTRQWRGMPFVSSARPCVESPTGTNHLSHFTSLQVLGKSIDSTLPNL